MKNKNRVNERNQIKNKLVTKGSGKINIGTFDLIKGIAMILVIFTHMRYRYNLDQLIFLGPLYILLALMGSSLMPMFFIISGIGHKEKTGQKMIKKTFSELIVPYLATIPVYLMIFTVMHWQMYGSKIDLFKQLFLRASGFLLGLPEPKVIYGYELIANGALWFFLALFWAQNLLNLIIKKRKIACQLFLVSVCVVSGLILTKYEFFYFCVPQGLIAVGYCYVGYMIKQRKLLENHLLSGWVYGILIPVFIVMNLWFMHSNRWFSLANGGYNLIECFMAGCSGVLLVFAGVGISGVKCKCLDLLRRIGMYSYWIIIIHSIETLSVPWYEISISLNNQLLAFLIELGLKILFIVTGCEIIKRISYLRYKMRMEKNGKIRNNERFGSAV